MTKREPKTVSLENKSEDKSENLMSLYILLGIIILVFSVFIVIISNQFDSWGDRGVFGDSFGVINALFSGLAFAGIIYTIFLQRKELGYQRKELELQRQELIETRKELKRSADAQEDSQVELRKQSENLKMTAKLNALNTLVNYYNEEFTRTSETRNRPLMELNQTKRNKYLEQITSILEGKQE